MVMVRSFMPSREVLQQIAALAQEQDFLVLSDEVYEKLIYDGAQHVSIASLDGMKERTITINGCSRNRCHARFHQELVGKFRAGQPGAGNIGIYVKCTGRRHTRDFRNLCKGIQQKLPSAGVATVPGTAFDSFCNSHIRLSYASSMESLQTAVSRLKGMLKK